MIILDEEAAQLPKLPNDPITRAANASSSEQPGASQAQESSTPLLHPRPASPALPDYETSQAEHRLLRRLRSKGKRGSRICKLATFAIILYLGLFVVVGIPLLVWKLRHGSQWHQHSTFDGIPSSPGTVLIPVPPQSPISSNGTFPILVGQAVECNGWHENVELPSFPGWPQMASASLQFVFPPTDLVILANSTASHSELPHFARRFELKMNPNESMTDIVMHLTVQYSRTSLFSSLKACLTKSNSSTGIGLVIPEDISPTDMLSIGMTLLLPKTTSSLSLDRFSTYLPAFEQVVGDLAPYTSLGEVGLEGPLSNVSIGSIKASTIYIQVSGGDISGTFNVTDSLSLDTINAPITANISLVNDGSSSNPTVLSLDTGNGPIHAAVDLHAIGRHFWIPHKAPDFITRSRTFNAPLELTVVHTESSKPSRHQLLAHNTQGSVNVTLDCMYSGTFDVETKSAMAFVQQIPNAPQIAEEDEDEKTEGWSLQMDRMTHERMLGWMGWGKRPRGKDKQGHVTIASSLSDVALQVVQPDP